MTALPPGIRHQHGVACLVGQFRPCQERVPESAKTRSKTVDEWVTDLTADLRLPWQRPAPDGWLTPARVRRVFRKIRANLPCPASAPKPGKPGPGRPPGSTNHRPAQRHNVGETEKKTAAKKNLTKQTG